MIKKKAYITKFGDPKKGTLLTEADLPAILGAGLAALPPFTHFEGPFDEVSKIAAPKELTLYLVGTEAPYALYALVSGELKRVGSTDIDLSGYALRADTEAAFAEEEAARRAAVAAEAAARDKAVSAEKASRRAADADEREAREQAVADEAAARRTADEELAARIEQGAGGGGGTGGLGAVSHDDTLTGDGTAANPLGVAGGGGGSASFPLANPPFDANTAKVVPLVRTDPQQASMSRGKIHGAVRFLVRPNGSNTFRTEIGQYREAASVSQGPDEPGDTDYAAGIGFEGNSQTSGTKAVLLWGAAKRMRETSLNDLGDDEMPSIALIKRVTGDPDKTVSREAEWGGGKSKLFCNSVSEVANRRGEIKSFKSAYRSEKSFDESSSESHSQTTQFQSGGAGQTGTGGIQEFWPEDINIGGRPLNLRNGPQVLMGQSFEWNVIKPNAAGIDDQHPARYSGLYNAGYTGNREPNYKDGSNFMSGWFMSDEDKEAMKHDTDLGNGLFIPAGNKFASVEFVKELIAAATAPLLARIAELEARNG